MVMVTSSRGHFVPLKSSGRVLGGLFLVHAAAVASVWGSGLPLWMQVPAALGGLCSFALMVCRVGVGSFPGQWQALGWGADGGWWLASRDGGRLMVRVLPGSVVLPGLILLSLRDETGRRHRLLLAGDSVAGGDLRPLRLCLRRAVRDRRTAEPGP
ncbi:hypothetical protein LQ956_09585 [Ectothiorhodospira sp. A-7Y]|nr:protein YgfX [Ectothiorhodospira lacustris]MCG5510503.1 hypothetical protein [Ectothiorhodospira lacustris]MCG5522249.1 hypothetical protein [Ectothiorhodospira lacustris]